VTSLYLHIKVAGKSLTNGATRVSLKACVSNVSVTSRCRGDHTVRRLFAHRIAVGKPQQLRTADNDDATARARQPADSNASNEMSRLAAPRRGRIRVSVGVRSRARVRIGF